MTKTLLGCGLMTAVFAGGAMAQEIRPGVYRTPDERFENLPDYDFAPR
jgi:hypothetical protein